MPKALPLCPERSRRAGVKPEGGATDLPSIPQESSSRRPRRTCQPPYDPQNLQTPYKH
jgi:hypothetical protein